MNATYQLALLDALLQRTEIERRAEVATAALRNLKVGALKIAQTKGLRRADAKWLRALVSDIQ